MQANEIVEEMSTGPFNAIIGILPEGSDLSPQPQAGAGTDDAPPPASTRALQVKQRAQEEGTADSATSFTRGRHAHTRRSAHAQEEGTAPSNMTSSPERTQHKYSSRGPCDDDPAWGTSAKKARLTTTPGV